MIPRLVAAGHSVVAISRDPRKIDALRSSGAEGAICDVFDAVRLAGIVQDTAPDAIVHQLTALPAAMNPRQLAAIYARNNRVRSEGTRNLLAAARAAKVTRMVLQSMGTWYRPEGGAVKTEQDPLWTDAPEPIGTAVRTVAAMEAAALKEMPIAVVLRYGAFYGPGTWYAEGGDLATRIRKRGYPIVGAGKGMTSFIHVDDAAEAACAALNAPASGVYNIVDDEPAPASVWMPVYAAAMGAPAPLRVPALLTRLALGKPLTKWITSMRGASNRAAAVQLGWRPRHSTWREGFRA
jgi:nucleoside-diphosphate-sugar epimerase